MNFLFVPTVYAQISDWDPTGTGTGGCMVDGVPTLKCFEIVFQNIVYISSALILVVLFVMLVIGAFHYLTSLGNPEKLKKAQGTLRYAIIGLVIFVSATLILIIIDNLFLGGRGKILKFQIGE